MIRFGLRLALGAGREAVARLVIIASAVALGVGLLLGTLAALNGTSTQNDRYAWFSTDRRPASVADAPVAGVDPLWWQLGADRFQGKLIGRVDVAATGPKSPVPPGIPRLPEAGEFYASPAMTELLRSVPADELADRYPGHEIGTIADSALPGPDSLVVVVGHRADEMATYKLAHQVTSISDVSPSSCDNSNCDIGTDSNGMTLILSVVAAALIFPVLVLIATATRLSATRREQRFAAMRLVGATPRQVSVASAAESTVAAVAGTAAGFALFFLIRPLLAHITFTNTPFFLSDLALTVPDVLLVALGVPIGAAVSARLALRRVQISPLGVSRQVTPRPPHLWRLLPVTAGLLELAYFIGRRPPTTAGQVRAFLPGAFLVLGGVVLAGPWLTLAGARLMAWRGGGVARLVAGRRLADDPKGGFRAVSGLVLALCVMSGAVGIIGGMARRDAVPPGGPAVRNTVLADYLRFSQGMPHGTTATPPDSLSAQLHAVPGVTGVTVIHSDPDFRPVPNTYDLGGLAECAQLAEMPAYRTCPPGTRGTAVARVPFSFTDIGFHGGPPRPATWPVSDMTRARLRSLPVLQIVVTTDGSRTAQERARTILAVSHPGQDPPYTQSEFRLDQNAELDSYRRLADVVIAISFPIAGCSLAVSVAGGLSDRRRPFSLLRLAGVQLRVLRRVVLLESVVPLLLVSVVSIGTGFLAAHLFLRAQLGYSLVPPDAGYYLLTAGGLVAALAVISATLPLLGRVTGPESARNT